MPETLVQLPQWQSHKKVWADKVVEVRKVGLADREGPDDSGWRWVLSCGAIITVSLELMSRVPRIACSDSTEFALGGYYVRYADGFESWSPAKAFEEGYTRIDD